MAEKVRQLTNITMMFISFMFVMVEIIYTINMIITLPLAVLI